MSTASTIPALHPLSHATIHFDELGDPDGVKLVAGGMKLLIDLMDSKRGRFVPLEEAMKHKLPTVEQACIIMAYINEINAKLQEAGGNRIDGSYYTSQRTKSDVQVFGYKDRGVYTYIVPTDSKAITCMYKVRQIRLAK